MSKPILSHRERWILDQRFGISGEKRRYQVAIAEELGLSRERVGMLEVGAVRKLIAFYSASPEKTPVERPDLDKLVDAYAAEGDDRDHLRELATRLKDNLEKYRFIAGAHPDFEITWAQAMGLAGAIEKLFETEGGG